MIKLRELLNITDVDGRQGLVPVDHWPFMHEQYLTDMGFKSDGIYQYNLKKPELTLSLKKGGIYVLRDKDRKETKEFLNFKDLEKYFEQYPQKWEEEEWLKESI